MPAGSCRPYMAIQSLQSYTASFTHPELGVPNLFFFSNFPWERNIYSYQRLNSAPAYLE
jgi:hypothetical protein